MEKENDTIKSSFTKTTKLKHGTVDLILNINRSTITSQIDRKKMQKKYLNEIKASIKKNK